MRRRAARNEGANSKKNGFFFGAFRFVLGFIKVHIRRRCPQVAIRGFRRRVSAGSVFNAWCRPRRSTDSRASKWKWNWTLNLMS
jgi:hypothetical protein